MKFAVIGNPIDKSLSPQLHEILYEKLNILNCSFEKIHLENDKLDDFFNNDFGLFDGINVTILPWIILSKDSQMIIPVDSVLTVVEPLETVTQLYLDKLKSFEMEEEEEDD